MRGYYAILLIVFFAETVDAKSRYIINITPTDRQSEEWNRGVQMVDDFNDESTVRIVNFQDELPDKQSTFRVYVKNKSSKPINISRESVSIKFLDGTSIESISFEELLARHKRDIDRRNTVAAIGNAFSQQGADGRRSESVDFSGSTADGNRVSGTGTFSYVDPELKDREQRAANQNNMNTKAYIQNRDETGQYRLDRLLRTSTVKPNETTGGVIAFDVPSKNKNRMKENIEIVVKFGEIEHKFLGKFNEME
jgi:hypothetical protein